MNVYYIFIFTVESTGLLCRCSLLNALLVCFFFFQLVNQNWAGEMRDGYWLGQDYPGIYQGDRQALNEDYTKSGFDRGHLNPNGHHAGMY